MTVEGPQGYGNENRERFLQRLPRFGPARISTKKMTMGKGVFAGKFGLEKWLKASKDGPFFIFFP